jgi:hypothetical protein
MSAGVVPHAGALHAKQRPCAVLACRLARRADIEDALRKQQQTPLLRRKPEHHEFELL